MLPRKLIVGKEFFYPKYSQKRGVLTYLGCGFDKDLLEEKKIPLTEVDDIHKICDGLYLMNNFEKRFSFENIPNRFIREINDTIEHDKYTDEMVVIIENEDSLTLVTNQFIQQTQQIAEFQRRKELVEDITDIIYGEQSELDTELSHLMDRMNIKINFPATVISIATEEESEFSSVYQQLLTSKLMIKANDIVLKRDTEYIIIKSQLEDPDYYLNQILENEEEFNLKIKNVTAGSPANNFKEIFHSFRITQIYKKSIWNYKKYNALDPDQLILIEFDKNNNNEDLIKPYVDQLIKKLDKMSSVWLYPTIDAYFLTDGRIQGMADKLNIHKNSCIYRVYKILNALELENARTFTVAYFLGRILQYKQPDLHKEN